MRIISCYILFVAAAAAASEPSGSYIRTKEYDITAAVLAPSSITLGPDGALWFTGNAGQGIGRITTSGVVSTFQLAPFPAENPSAIATGPDGALWFTGADLGRVTTEGAITLLPIAGSANNLGITAGPDGALWFPELYANAVGRVTTSGEVTLFPVPTGMPGTDSSYPSGITVGPDGALWFTERQGNKIGRITTDGVITEYPLEVFHGPLYITTGPDGALWFTEQAGIVGRISTAGAVRQYSAQANGFGAGGAIASGPDGALWFTAPESEQVGRITMSGIITFYPAPSGSQPLGITAGPDGNMWITEFLGNKIARIPACGLGLRASFDAGTLTLNFDLGINHPAVWTVTAGTGFSFTRHISKSTPSKPLRFAWHNYPNMGNVEVRARLADEKGLVYCSEWTAVDTGMAVQ